MEATDILRREHKAISVVLDSLDRASTALINGVDVPPWVFKDSLDFIQNFADRCHHHKEEGRLFPLYGERGLPTAGGPIKVMTMEHMEGRKYISEASEEYQDWFKGDKAAGICMAEALLAYVKLLREHIDKEDNVLYPMGDKLLSQADDQMLIKQFDDIEEQEMGPGVHEKYHAMIDKLEEATAKL